jgi:hypothetical protein
MAVGARHRFAPLKRAFHYQKGASKRLNGACITALSKQIKALWWSDPNCGSNKVIPKPNGPDIDWSIDEAISCLWSWYELPIGRWAA